MIEFIIALVVAGIAWGLRKSWYAQSNIFNTKIEIRVAEQEVELQDDLASLSKQIKDVKESQDGTWHTLKDVVDQMK